MYVLRWQLQNGGVAFVQTPETQRAKQLMELYMQVLLLIPLTLMHTCAYYRSYSWLAGE